MNKKIFLIFALIFLAVPFVSATQVTSNPTIGFIISTPDHASSLQVNTNHTWHFHVFNASSGYPILPNKTVSCEFNLYQLNSGMQVNEMTPVVSKQNDIWEFDADNMTSLGEYSYIFHCNDTIQGGFLSETFSVTKTGEDTSKFDYLPLVLVVLGIIAVILYIGTQFGNEQALVKSIMMILPLFFLVGLAQIGKSYIDNIYGSGTVTQILTPIMIILPWLAFGFMTYLFINLALKVINKVASGKKESQGYDPDD